MLILPSKGCRVNGVILHRLYIFSIAYFYWGYKWGGVNREGRCFCVNIN